MSDQFNIDAKLVIAGVEVKGDLNAGKLKFDIDTSALKKLVQEAATAATKVKTQIDGIKFDKIKVELNQNSLRTMQTQIRKTIQSAVKGVQLGNISAGKGVTGKIARTTRATKATQEAVSSGKQQTSFRNPATGRFEKAAEALQFSSEALRQVLQQAGATIRPNNQKKFDTKAEINAQNRPSKGQKDIQKDLDALKKNVALDKSTRAQKASAEKAAHQKRLSEISQESQAQRAANLKNHQLRMAQLDAETAKAAKAIGKRKGGLSEPPMESTFRGRNASRLRQEFQLGRRGGIGAVDGGAPDASQGGGRGTGTLSSLGGGGGGGGGGGRGPGASPGGPGRGGGGVNDAAAGLAAMTSETKKASKEMENLENLTFQVGKKAAAFRGVAIAINTIVTASQAAVKFVIDFNDSLIEVNKILKLSDASVKKFGDDLFGLSAATGVAVSETIAIAEQFARAGLSGRGYGSVVDLTARALTGMQGTTLDASQATELFIQIIQQVEGGARGLNKELVTTTKLFDVLGKAEDITASKATDVQAAFKRSAASVLATGTSIEQATTLISVLQERTQRGGDVIGTALKTMAARISSSSSDATKALKSIGVETIDAQGNLRNLFDVLQDTSIAFKNLSESEQADIAVKAAGIRQVEIFRSAVRDFGRVQEVNTQLMGASGDATRKQKAEFSKLGNALSRLELAFQQMVKTASDSTLGTIFVAAIRLIESVATGISKFDKMIGGALSTTIALGAAVIGLKIVIPMLAGMGRAVQFFVKGEAEAAKGMDKIGVAANTAATTVKTQLGSAIDFTISRTERLRLEMEGVAAAAARVRLGAGGVAGAGGMPGAVAPGNEQRGGGAIIGVGATSLPGKQDNRSRLAKAADKARAGVVKQSGKLVGGLKSLVTNASALSIATAVLGGVMSAASESIREAGHDTTATGVEAIGGALQGAGSGALIGSLIAPGIGTAIGAVLGGIGGALPTLGRAFDDTSHKTDALAKDLMRLGVITSANGEITSEAAQKIEAAFRNIQEIQGLEVGFSRKARIADKDPKLANKQAKEEDVLLEKLIKALDSSVNAQNADVANRSAILSVASQLVQQRSGKNVNLAGSSVSDQGIEFEKVSLEGVKGVQKAFLDIAKAKSFDPAAIEQFQLKLGEILKTRTNRSAGEKRQEVRDVTAEKAGFKNLIDTNIPQPSAFGDVSIQAKGIKELNEVLIDISEGRADKSDPRLDAGIAIAIERGFLTRRNDGELEKVEGQAARIEIDDFAEKATQLAKMFKDISGSGLAPIVLKSGQAFVEFIAKMQAAGDTVIAIENIAKRAAGTQAAFTGVDEIAPKGSIGGDVNELQLIFRTFIQDFSREVLKLNEVRIRATTPQAELANALAMNARDVLLASEKNAKIRETTSRQTAKLGRSKIGNQEKLIGSSPNELRSAFPELKKDPEGIEKRVKARAGGADFQKTLDELLRGGSDKDLAEVLGIKGFKSDKDIKDQAAKTGALPTIEDDEEQKVIRARITKMRAFASKTVGSVLDSIFSEGQKLIDEAIKTGIDPTEGFKNLAKTVKGFENLTLDNQKAVTKILEDHFKRSVNIAKSALDARLTFNRLNLAAIKTSIAEERKTLNVDKERREAAALNIRAMNEELTGIRRLVAEREISNKLAKAEIAGIEGRLSGVGQKIAGIESGPKPQTKEEEVTQGDQLKVLRDEQAKTEIELAKKVGNLRIATMRDVVKAANLASNEGKRAAQGERGRTNTLSEIGSLLSIDEKPMAEFNAEMATLNANFKISQAEVAAQAEAAGKIQNKDERDDAIAKARQAGITVALEMAKAEAAIESKRRSAIKQVASELLANQDAQVSAQKAVIDTTKALSDAYEAYLQTVDGVVMATTQYNLQLSLADVASRKTTGGFTGLREEIGAVQAAFGEAERMAAQMGASEKTLVDIRRQSIDQQLTLFNELLSQQSAAARSFFTSSAEDQADLVRGINEAKGIADLFGGSFDAFKGKSQDEGALNQLGSQIMSLPQDMRKRIQEAIETLKVTGGTVGGFTAAELETAINSASFGESAELKVDPLFEVQERIATLQQEQAKIATEQLIAANEAMLDSKKGVELAEEQKALAEIQLERTKEEGEKLREKMGELTVALQTTLLSQIEHIKQGSKGIMSAVEKAATRMITELPIVFNAAVGNAINKSNAESRAGGIPVPGGAPTKETDSKIASDSQQQPNKAVDSAAAGAAGAKANQPSAPSGNTSNNPRDPNTATFVKMLAELAAINKTSTTNLGVTQEIKNDQDKKVGTAAATVTGDKVEIAVSIAGTSTVTVTGFEAGVARIAQALAETMGGFATEEEARVIAEGVVENIRKVLLEKQIINLNTK